VQRIGPGLVLQHRPSRFQTALLSSDRAPCDSALSRHCSDRAAVSRPRQCASDVGATCRCCLHVPTMQRARIAFARHTPELTFPSSSHRRSTPEHPRTAAAESTAAPLRSVTSHPKPATALPPTRQPAPSTSPSAGHRRLPSTRAVASASTCIAASGLRPTRPAAP
jgi:hypothetical protein